MYSLATPARCTEIYTVFGCKAIPEYGLVEDMDITVTSKSDYGPGEIVLVERVSDGALVICAHIVTDLNGYCFLLPECAQRHKNFSGWHVSRASAVILGSVYECRNLRAIPILDRLRI